MASIEDVRKWLQGEDVEGLPPRDTAWGERTKAALVKDESDFAQKMRKKANAEMAKRLGRHGGKTVKDGMARFTVSADGADALLLFGKHNGSNVSDLAKSNPGYLEWMKTQEFPKALLDIINHQASVLTTLLHDEEDDDDVPRFTRTF